MTAARSRPPIISIDFMSAQTHGLVRRAIVILFAIASAVLTVAPSSSDAAIGDIVGHGCISKTGADGCTTLPQSDALLQAASVAVAPDGTDVYVGAGRGIAHLRRAANGDLTYASCVDTNSAVGDSCPTAAPADGGGSLTLNSITVAISPNGKTVYATSWADALTWWSRDLTTGQLTWGGCRDGAAAAATNGRCGTATTIGGGNFPAGSIDFPQGMEITPDGTSLFIADQTEGLLQAQLNPTTGVPTPQACFNTTGSAAAGCTSLASGFPMASSGLAIAPSSRDIYLSSISPGGVTHFQRTPSGVTTLHSCIGASAPTAQCLTAAPNPSFFNLGAIGVGGSNVFTHGGIYGATPEGTVTRLARSATGSLSFVNCSTTVAASGACAVLPTGTLTGNIGRLPVTPDGSAVYSRQGGNPSALMRLTGDLAFGSCWGLGVPACTAPPLPVPFAAAVGGSAFSPDGAQLYQAAADQINTLRIQTSPSAPTSPMPAAKPTAKKPQIRSVKKVRKGKRRGQYKVRVRVSQAGTIKIQLRGRLKKGTKIRAVSKSVKRTAKRSGALTLYVKPSKTAVKRRVKSSLEASLSAAGYMTSSISRKTVRLR